MAPEIMAEAPENAKTPNLHTTVSFWFSFLDLICVKLGSSYFLFDFQEPH